MVIVEVRNAISGEVAVSLEFHHPPSLTVKEVRMQLAHSLKASPHTLALFFHGMELYPDICLFDRDYMLAISEAPEMAHAVQIEFLRVKRTQKQLKYLPKLESVKPTRLSGAPHWLQKDVVLVAAATHRNPALLQTLPLHLLCEKRVCMAAVAKDGSALQWGSEEHRDSADVVRMAVRNTPCALQWASCRLKADEEVVRAAVIRGGTRVLVYASRLLRQQLETWANCVDDVLDGIQ